MGHRLDKGTGEAPSEKVMGEDSLGGWAGWHTGKRLLEKRWRSRRTRLLVQVSSPCMHYILMGGRGGAVS